LLQYIGDHLCDDRMVLEFTTFLCNQCLSLLKLSDGIRSLRGVLDATLCDKVCQ